MDTDDIAFVASTLRHALLNESIASEASDVDQYWSGSVSIPKAIDEDLASYLLNSDQESISRVAHWVTSTFYLSDGYPDLHIRLVRWLHTRGLISDADAVQMLALEITNLSTLTEEAKAIVMISRETLDENRMDDWHEIVLPMLMEY